MPGMDSLTHIVYCLCNDLEYENSNLTESQQYKTQLNELLREEKLIKKTVFNIALDFVKETEHKDYLRHIFWVLSQLTGLLKDAIANTSEDRGITVIMLQREALSVIQRLTTFFGACFSGPRPKKKDNTLAVQMFKLPISVSMMATLTKALVKGTGIADAIIAARVMRFVIRHFSSINTEIIAYDSFRNNYDKPHPRAIRECLKILEKMIGYLKSL